MLRLTLSLLAAAAFSSAAMAHPEPKTPSSKTQPFTMPSQAELAKARANMPDFNAIFDGMSEAMEDEDAQAGMKRSMDIMKSRMGDMKNMRRANGKPDFNMIMDNMFGLVGDEEFMGGMMSMMGPMQEVMEEHAPAPAAPNQKRIDKQKMREFE